MSEITTTALLREVTRLYVQVQRQGAACCNETTLSQCLVLTEVGRHQPLTLMALSNRLGLGKSWTSRSVERLVRQGLLLKTTGETDRRQVYISLSPAGLTRFQALEQTLNSQAQMIMERIPATKRANVFKALELLLAALQTETERNYEYDQRT